MAKKRSGFTIVELLIVIVVIAILATISIVAYSGIQARARDSQRKSDLAAIAKALEIRAIDNSSEVRSGATCSSQPGGWFSQAGTSLTGTNYGTKSAAECLAQESNTSVIRRDPSGASSCVGSAPDTCYAYMFCSVGQETYVFAHLETIPFTGTSVDGAGCNASYDSLYGMNYFVRASRSQ